MHFGRFPRKTLLAATLLLAFSSANASFVEQIGTPSLPLAVMGTYAADAKLKSGLKAVIPAGWQLFQHQSVEMPDALSWEPADTWVAALNKFASKNDIAVLIDWDKKAVYFRSTSLALQEQEKRQMIAQAASTPLPSFTRPATNPAPVKPADKPTLAAAAPSASPVPAAKTVAAPVPPSGVAPRALAAAPAAPAAPAAVVPVTATLAVPAALPADTRIAAGVKPVAAPVAIPAAAAPMAPVVASAVAPVAVSVTAPAAALAAAPVAAAAVAAVVPAASAAAPLAAKPALKTSVTRPALRQVAIAPAVLPVAPAPVTAPLPAVLPAVAAPALAVAVPAAPAAQPAVAPATPGAVAFNREAVSKVVASAGAKHGYTVSWEAPQVVFPGPVTLLGADMGEDMRLVLRALGGRRAPVSMTVYRDSNVVVVREAPYGKADVAFTDVPFSGALREPAPLKDARTLFASQPAVTVAQVPAAPLAVLPPVRPVVVASTPAAVPVRAPAPAARVAAVPVAPSPTAEPLRVTPEPARLATAVESVKKLEPAKPAVAADLRMVTLRVAAGGSLRDAIEAQLEPGWTLKWDVAGAFEANTELKASGESLVAVLNQVLPRLKLSADIYKPSKLVVVREADPALDK